MALNRIEIAGTVKQKRNFSLLLLMLFFSVALHLTAFIIWQLYVKGNEDQFYFTMEEPPALELTLLLNEVLEPEPVEPEPLEPIIDTEVTSEAETKAPKGKAETTSETTLDEDLLKSELLDDTDEETTPASAEPPVLVESEAPEFKRYETAIRLAIAKWWIMPPEALENFRPGRLSVDVSIGRGGDLLRIVVLESSGSATLDHAGLEALRAAAPYPPMPEYMEGLEHWTLRINFDYQAQTSSQ